MPLQVELRTAITETRQLAIPDTVPEIPLSLPDQDRGSEPVAAQNTQQPVDVPKLLNLPANIYYASSEVDARAEPLNEVNLVYPELPYQQRRRGVVRLNIFVNEQGGLDKVVIVDANPKGVFEEAALQAVNELKFTPAIKNGLPVKNRKAIEVTFDPYEKFNRPNRELPNPSAMEK